MDTMRDELVNLRKELLQPTAGKIFEANYFVEEVLRKLYKKQVRTNPNLDICAVALRYDEMVMSYQVLPWDCEMCDYLNKGESTIDEKSIPMILKWAQEAGAVAFSEDEAKELGIIPEEQKANELEKRWGWKQPKEEKDPKTAKKDWYILFDVKICKESTEEPQTEEPQKEMG